MENSMKKWKTEPVNQELRKEVLQIIDILYSNFSLLDRETDNIALQIIEAIGFDYCLQNCELGLIFENLLAPFLKKLSENNRLEKVKGLLTDGYIDTDQYRIYMRYMPYINYSKSKESPGLPYMSPLSDCV